MNEAILDRKIKTWEDQLLDLGKRNKMISFRESKRAKLTLRLRNCNEQFSTMDAWIDLRDCKKACVDNGLEEFIVTAEDTYYPAGMLKDVFMKSFYYEWFEKFCAGIESVSTFRVRTQESRVEAFRELDAHQLPVDQMRIREKLIREMPSRFHPRNICYLFVQNG